jgi:small subunit ribosomal protein S7
MHSRCFSYTPYHLLPELRALQPPHTYCDIYLLHRFFLRIFLDSVSTSANAGAMFSLRHRVAHAFWASHRSIATTAVSRGSNERLSEVLSSVFGHISGGGAPPPFPTLPSAAAAAATATPADSLPSLAPASSSSTTPIIVPQYEDPTLVLFTSLIQRHGNRHRAQNIISKMLLHIHGMTGKPPLPLFRQAISMASPSVRMKTLKRGGRNVLTPQSLNEKQRTRAAILWILEVAGGKVGKGVKRNRGPGGHRLEQRIARVIVGILTDPHSSVLTKKMALHQLAVQNRSVPFFLRSDQESNVSHRSNIGMRM